MAKFMVVLLSLTSLGMLASCDIPNVFEFCTALMSDKQNSCSKATCQGRPGKRGPVGPKGNKGVKGDTGATGTSVALEARVKQLEDTIAMMKKVFTPNQKLEFCAMGMKSRDIADADISTSSDWESFHHGQYGRLDEQPASNPTSYGSWISRKPRIGDWIQIDLGMPKAVSGVVTQGRPTSYDQWVTSYKIKCGNFTNSFQTIMENNQEKVFQGNNDRNTKVTNIFPNPVVCRYVRLYPQRWHVHLSMRMEILRGECYDLLNELNTKNGHAILKQRGEECGQSTPGHTVDGCKTCESNMGKFVVVLLSLTSVGMLASCDIPNVFEFCTALMSDKQNSCNTATCQGRPGKRGPVGSQGNKGAKGDTGATGTSEALEARVKQLEDTIIMMKKVFTPNKKLEFCAMGMKSRDIADADISTSSDWESFHHGQYGRLDEQPASNPKSYGAWISRKPQIGDWIQIDLRMPNAVSGVVTQGRPASYDQWVTAYKIKCGNSTNCFQTIMENDQEKVFQGNNDRNTKVTNIFPNPLVCRYVRLYPQRWYGHLSMRMEILRGECYDFY
ncbi:EGF-like repeat and discoidin I-like domain-containing protein 3 [Styela clava]